MDWATVHGRSHVQKDEFFCVFLYVGRKKGRHKLQRTDDAITFYNLCRVLHTHPFIYRVTPPRQPRRFHQHTTHIPPDPHAQPMTKLTELRSFPLGDASIFRIDDATGKILCRCASGYHDGEPAYCLPSCPFVPIEQGFNTTACGVTFGTTCPLQCAEGQQLLAGDGTGSVQGTVTEATCMAATRTWSARCR